MYDKDPYKAKYKILIKKRQGAGLKHYKDSKAFIGYSNEMDDIYEKIKNTIYIWNVKYWSYLMIWLQIVTELTIRGRKINILLGFITQYSFAAQKVLDWFLSTILLWKFQTNKRFNSQLIIHQTWTL